MSFVEEDIHQFWNSASLLGDKLGLVLLQIAPDMPNDPERLRRAILAFGNPHQVAVEFRAEEWFYEEIQALLLETGAVFCDAESPRFQLTGRVTSSTGYIRLHGRRHRKVHFFCCKKLRFLQQKKWLPDFWIGSQAVLRR